MPDCKNCKSKAIVKNGTARGKQRHKCKSCGYNFVAGPPSRVRKIGFSGQWSVAG